MRYGLLEYVQQCITFEQFNVLNNLISLWQRYVMWRRALFSSIYGDTAIQPAVQSRVDQIPIDFYNTLRVFYGERLAEQFATAFQVYSITHINLMEAMINNDQELINTYTKKLYTSADEMAAILSKVPYWQVDQWKAMLYRDISWSLANYRATLTSEYEMEISIFERMLLNAAEMGSYMARGIFASKESPIPSQT